MPVARFRFYAELNDFLPLDRRFTELEYDFVDIATVKDRIESFGVPHVEVDLILVNGNAVDFDYTLTSEAKIEVFPPGKKYPSYNEKRLQVTTALCFVADGHLGKLTRNLRLLGFDVAYDPRAEDRQLLEVMHHENRALLTRDRRLLMHSMVRTGYCPRSQHSDEQTIEVIRRFDLLTLIAPFTRCLRCNATLKKVAKGDVIEKLEPRTKVYYEEFRRCTGCSQIYWAGSQFPKLQKRLEAIRAQCS